MRCKVGDMAEILSGPNQGAIVEVVGVDNVSSLYYGQHCWFVHAAWPMMAYVGVNPRQLRTDASAPDEHLRPIRPPETPVTETRDEELTV